MMREWTYTASSRDVLRCTSPPTKRFPSALEMSLGLHPWDIPSGLGISVELRGCTDTVRVSPSVTSSLFWNLWQFAANKICSVFNFFYVRFYCMSHVWLSIFGLNFVPCFGPHSVTLPLFHTSGCGRSVMWSYHYDGHEFKQGASPVLAQWDNSLYNTKQCDGEQMPRVWDSISWSPLWAQ